MFITRKQLEEEKAKAVEETQEKLWLRNRFDILEKRVYELEDRLRVLEYGPNDKCVVNANDGNEWHVAGEEVRV